MNKIKVLYDVFKTVKGKEAFKGEFKLNAEKDGAAVLNLSKEFEVNILNGNGSFKLEAGLECCGNKVKHEGSTEFNFKDYFGNNAAFMKICGCHEDTRRSGIKGYIDRITFLLGLLNKINLKESEDGAVLTLDLKDFCREECPGCSRADVVEENSECCGEYNFLKEFLNCGYDESVLTVRVNSKSEIERIEAESKASDRRIKTLLNLIW